MLTIVFAVVFAWVALKMLVWGIRATWGITKIICTSLLLPVLILGLIYVCLASFAVPIIVTVIVVLLVCQFVRA